MILVAPAKVFKAAFRKDETYTDETGTPFVIEEAVAAKFKGEDGTVDEARAVLFGEPRWESPNAANREKLPNGSEARIAFSHPWDEGQIRWITDNILPAHSGAALVEVMPADWYVAPETTP